MSFLPMGNNKKKFHCQSNLLLLVLMETAKLQLLSLTTEIKEFHVQNLREST